uniref:Beta-1,4-N-acetylgalactosaminyltransferase n=1 Tax=Cacopsylla melanoneura TaxID=428564 RepID=A0A8D8LMX3_9HEMI
MVSVLCQHVYKVLIIVVLALVLIEFTFSVLNETHYTVPFLTPNYSSPFMPSSMMYLNLTTTQRMGDNTSTGIAQFCPVIPPNLQGPLKIYKKLLSSDELQDKLKPLELELGGTHRPQNCIALFRVAIIVPYRDRVNHLQLFLYNIHPMLVRQQLDYTIFIVEQMEGQPFNRAALFNVGFIEANKIRGFDCFIFHDVDLIPEDDRNLYTCPGMPRHMSVAVDSLNYKLPYASLFGGVCALSKEHFVKVNGFSNEYWGWGGEDDDMSMRLKLAGLQIIRYPPDIAKYTMLKHRKEKANPQRYEKLYSGHKRYKKDGLNSSQYKVLDAKQEKLFTWFLVQLGAVS